MDQRMKDCLMNCSHLTGALMIVLLAAQGLSAQETEPGPSTAKPATAVSRAEARFKALDRNQDGVLDPQEFRRPRLFKAMDKNADGRLTLSEVKAAVARKQQASSRKTVDMTVHKDVSYATVKGVKKSLLAYDVYVPKTKGPHPVMIMIHGGGWAIGDKGKRACGMDKAHYFVGLGYVYVSLNYRLSPAITHPVHIQDVAKALAVIHDGISQYRGDPKRMVLMGHSAGAHLAALIATDDSRLKSQKKSLSILKAVILLDGAGYDIPKRLSDASVTGRARKMFEDAFTKDAATQKNASPMTHISSGKAIPPFLIIHAGRRQIAQSMAESMQKALTQAGSKAKVYHAQDKNHGSVNKDIGLKGDPVSKQIEGFLKSLTKPKSSVEEAPSKKQAH